MAFGYQLLSLQRVHSIRLYRKTTLLQWNPEISSVGIIWNRRISPFFMEQSSEVSQKTFLTGFLSYKRDCLRSLEAKIEQQSLGESCRGYPHRYWFFNKGFIQQTTLQAYISRVLKPARLARIETKNLLHLIFKTNWMTSVPPIC